MRVAFFTTIFPIKESYLVDFFSSLEKQTYKNFDTIILNDGYKDLEEFTKEFDLNIEILDYSNTPAKNREFGINYILEQKYDRLIFGDSDDYFSSNRVEKSLELLDRYNIVVNDLTLFNENGTIVEKYISHRLENGRVIDYEFIEDKNIFGLSNTSINLNILNRVKFPEDLVAVDWYLYKALLKEHSAIFTNEAITYYRQYESNTVGLKNDGKFKFWWEE